MYKDGDDCTEYFDRMRFVIGMINEETFNERVFKKLSDKEVEELKDDKGVIELTEIDESDSESKVKYMFDHMSYINHKCMADIKNIGVFIKTTTGKIMGSYDETRWNNAKWYQKIIGRVSNKYKNKFIDIMPFDIEIPKFNISDEKY